MNLDVEADMTLNYDIQAVKQYLNFFLHYVREQITMSLPVGFRLHGRKSSDSDYGLRHPVSSQTFCSL